MRQKIRGTVSIDSRVKGFKAAIINTVSQSQHIATNPRVPTRKSKHAGHLPRLRNTQDKVGETAVVEIFC